MLIEQSKQIQACPDLKVNLFPSKGYTNDTQTNDKRYRNSVQSAHLLTYVCPDLPWEKKNGKKKKKKKKEFAVVIV